MSFSISDRDLDLSKWKVADLKKELKLRGLSVEGKKNDLVVRLQLALGGSSVLDDAASDQDDLLDEDVLMDEADPLEDSDLIKSDTLETEHEVKLSSADLKRKSSDNGVSEKQAPSKKIILNRNFVSVKKDDKTEGKENKTNSDAEETQKMNVVKVGSLTPQERLERRAAKFGVAVSNEAKKEARAARFGLNTSGGKIGGSVGTNIEVLKKRAERFGTTLPGSILEKAEIEERKKKREERFGKVEVLPSTFKGKPNPRLSAAEQKKQMRAQRFKLNT
ncbi:UNVERIFIED_CONTAM: hypothetical protein PYX00_004353 [Menopon gallinae]|uniref:SAP domain-containing protein n=1 Tax=Menopon gallinae TaxID=328185 RepID=A0AAW2I4B1_9NEOP